MSAIQEERRIAQRLKESIRAARNHGDPLLQNQYGSVLSSADKLVRYFEKMAEVLDDTATDAEKLSRELRTSIEDSNDRLRKANNSIVI